MAQKKTENGPPSTQFHCQLQNIKDALKLFSDTWKSTVVLSKTVLGKYLAGAVNRTADAEVGRVAELRARNLAVVSR